MHSDCLAMAGTEISFATAHMLQTIKLLNILSKNKYQYSLLHIKYLAIHRNMLTNRNPRFNYVIHISKLM